MTNATEQPVELMRSSVLLILISLLSVMAVVCVALSVLPMVVITLLTAVIVLLWCKLVMLHAFRRGATAAKRLVLQADFSTIMLWLEGAADGVAVKVSRASYCGDRLIVLRLKRDKQSSIWVMIARDSVVPSGFSLLTRWLKTKASAEGGVVPD